MRLTQVRSEQSPEEMREQVTRRGINKAFQAEGTRGAKALRLLPWYKEKY